MSREGEPQRRGEQRRGAELRRHILFAAKDVFLETGYERASMDAVAARAGTSKRSLYAHFESKDKLFLAVLDFVRELYLRRLQTPDAYAADPVQAVTLFCARFQQLIAWEPQVRTSRLSIAAAERLPGSSAAYFDGMFASSYQRLSDYLAGQYGMGQRPARRWPRTCWPAPCCPGCCARCSASRTRSRTRRTRPRWPRTSTWPRSANWSPARWLTAPPRASRGLARGGGCTSAAGWLTRPPAVPRRTR